MAVTRDVALEVALDEYLHMLERVAPWLLEPAEDVLRPFCHWLYARTAFDVPMSAADADARAAFAAEARMDAVAAAALEDAYAALQRFAGQQLHTS